MANMNNYAKWMQEARASIHTGGYRGRNGQPGKYAIVYDDRTGLQWTEARAPELEGAIAEAMEKTKTVPRPLHEADVAAESRTAELAAAKARIAELEKQIAKVPPKKPEADEDGEMVGMSGMSIEQAGKARLIKK